MSHYQIKPDGDQSFVIYNAAGYQVAKLEAGFTLNIILTYQNLSQYNHRGDDYMAGVVDGMMHMQMLRPDCFSTLPEVPPIGPAPED